MRALLLVGLLAAAVLAAQVPMGSAAADCNDPFAKPEEVLDFHIQMARADWTKLLASRIVSADGMAPDSPACLEAFPKFQAKFRCGDAGPWLDVGLRKKKGEERGVEAFEKPPMKIDFNEDFMGAVPAAKGQRWPLSLGELGYRKLTLNSGQSNKFSGMIAVLPVLQAEHVALRMLAKEIPLSPKTAYAKVTMHFEDKPAGEYHGVYILIEDIDRTALRRRGLAGTGRLEKVSSPNCSPEVDFDDGPPNAKSAYDAFIAKDPSSFPGTWAAEAEKGIDLDTVLRQEASREIIVNGNDTIFTAPYVLGYGTNWSAHDPREGLRQYIPWDLDLAFGQQAAGCQPTPLQCPATVPLMTWCTGSGGTRASPYAKTLSRLGLKLPCHAEVKKRYLQVMCEMTQGSLAAEGILKVWNESYASLSTVVPLEKDFVWKGIDPMGAPQPGAMVIETFASEYARIKAWIPERIKFIQTELGNQGVTCAATCATGATSPCSHLGCSSQRRCEGGRWTACQAVPCGGPPVVDGGASDARPRTDAGTGAGMPGAGGLGAGGSSAAGAGGRGAGAAGTGGTSGGASGGKASVSGSPGCSYGRRASGGWPLAEAFLALLGWAAALRRWRVNPRRR